MKIPPSPKGSPIIGHLNGFKNDPINFMLDATNELGEVVLFKLLNKKIYLINNPEGIKHVLQNNYKNYVKSPGYKPLRLIGGTGIFTNDGEEWVRRRKFYQPAFNHTSVVNYSKTVVALTDEMLQDWKSKSENNEINISVEMMKITLGIIGETLFSTKINYGSELWNHTNFLLHWISKRTLRNPFVVPVSWPTKENNAFRKSKAYLDNLILNIIKDKKLSEQVDEDLLTRFMNPEDESLVPLNNQELIDEVMTIFLAGHETSANVLAWACYMIAIHQDVQEKMSQEIKLIGNQSIQYEDIKQLNYTVQVLNETMRLYPPVWHLGRMNIEADEIAGYKIPPGTHVRMSPLTLHRNKNYWENPNQFDPDRFEISKQKEQHPFSFIPFGAGPRLCAGRNFAMMEMAIILANIIKNFKLDYKGKPVEMAPLMTLRSQGDIQLQIIKK